jgi:phage terminase large subunit GpA-like protein
VKWNPKYKNDPDRIKRERLAWYECPHCEKKIKDDDGVRNRIFSLGKWCPKKCKILPNGKIKGNTTKYTHRGYWINVLYSPWVTWSETAAEFLDVRHDPPKLMNFVNSWLAQPWEERTRNIEVENLDSCEGEYQRGMVPQDARVLLAGVDFKKTEIHYSIHAFGTGETNWMVQCGILPGNDPRQLINLLVHKAWEQCNTGQKLRVAMACLDSGWETDTVYELCRRYPEVFIPIKGKDDLAGVPIKFSKIDKALAGPIPEGLNLAVIDTNYFKIKLVGSVNKKPPNPGSFNLHEDSPEDYKKHLCSEHEVLVRGPRSQKVLRTFVKKAGAGPNHFLDATVYALAAADIYGVYTWTEAEYEEPPGTVLEAAPPEVVVEEPVVNADWAVNYRRHTRRSLESDFFD